jgi:hypothetical protein
MKIIYDSAHTGALMIRKLKPPVVALLLILLFISHPSRTVACPWCRGDAPGVNPVKIGILNDSFWLTVATVLAPFPVLGAIVAFIYFTPQGFRNTSDE